MVMSHQVVRSAVTLAKGTKNSKERNLVRMKAKVKFFLNYPKRTLSIERRSFSKKYQCHGSKPYNFNAIYMYCIHTWSVNLKWPLPQYSMWWHDQSMSQFVFLSTGTNTVLYFVEIWESISLRNSLRPLIYIWYTFDQITLPFSDDWPGADKIFQVHLHTNLQ
jgi:hypothetical protein